MNDVTHLMSKLKANVTYREFAEVLTEARTVSRPALGAPTASTQEPVAAAAEIATAIVAALVPVQPRRALLLQSYVATPAAPASRSLAEIFARLETAARKLAA